MDKQDISVEKYKIESNVFISYHDELMEIN